MSDPKHGLPPPDQQHPPRPHNPTPELDTDQRGEDMARPDDEVEPNEATDGRRRANITTMGGSRRGSANGGEEQAEKKKPNRLAALAAKWGLDAGTIIAMFK